MSLPFFVRRVGGVADIGPGAASESLRLPRRAGDVQAGDEPGWHRDADLRRASTTHSGVAKALREEMGLSDAPIRIPVGIGNADDLIANLE
jgi:hypothetical protein